MRTVINSTMGSIPAGRILSRTARSIPLCSRISGGAPVNLRTGFPNLFPGAQGRVTVTAAGLAPCRLGLHGAGVMSNDAVDLGSGTSTAQSRNTFTAPLRQVTTDVDPVGTIDLTMALDDAVVMAGGAGFFGVSRSVSAADASFSAWTEGEVALVEFVESVVTPGKFICPDSVGRARYYDSMVDSDVLGQVSDTTIVTVGEARFIRVMIALRTI